jgi:WhiB family redox-sensing transcriptional regulator
VRGACLEFAIETNQDWGVWGGTSEDERRDIRRRRAAERRSSRLLA